MTHAANAIVAAIGLLLIAGVGPAMAAADRVPPDQDSLTDICTQALQDYHRLLDKQRNGTLTPDDKRLLADLRSRVRNACSGN